MPSVNATISATIGGVVISGKVTRDGETPLGLDTTLPAAKTGTLTTRTDNDTGVATMATGHGFTTGNTVDVYWSTGVRYGMTATVAGDAVTVDGGAGDNLPAQDTAVTMAAQVTADIDFTPEIAQLFMVHATRKSSIRLMAGASVALAVLLQSNEVYFWAEDLGVTNPLGASDITEVLLSNGDSAGTNRVRGGVVLDSVA